VANALVVSIILLLAGTVFAKGVLDGSVALPPPVVATPLGFLLFLGLLFTVFAAHVWPAELVLVSWAATALVFFSVYALVAASARGSDNARRTVISGVLATAALVALYGIWQRFVGLEWVRETVRGTAAGRELLTIPGAEPRVASDEIYATFVTSNAFAGYLVLLLPPAVGVALAARAGHRMVAGIAAWALAALLAIALVLTKSMGGTVAGLVGWAVFAWLLWRALGLSAWALAMLIVAALYLTGLAGGVGSVVAGAAVFTGFIWGPAALGASCLAVLLWVDLYLTGSAGVVGAAVAGLAAFASALWGRPAFAAIRSRMPSSRGARRVVVVSAAVVGLACAALAAVWLLRHPSMKVRLDYWRAALRMIWHHPTGVGLGNFGEFYTRYKTSSGWETREAHSVYLGLAAEAGVAALVALAFLVRGFFRSTCAPPQRQAEREPVPESTPGDAAGPGALARPTHSPVPTGAGPQEALRARMLGLLGGVSGILIAYMISYVVGGLPIETVESLVGGRADSAQTVTALMFVALVPLWIWLFWLFHRIDAGSPAVRAGLLAGIAGLLVHGLVDFDSRIKATMLTAAALGACAISLGDTGGRPAKADLRGGRSIALSFVMVGALALVFWRGTIRTVELSLYAVVASGEESAASELGLLRRRSRLMADSPRVEAGAARWAVARARELGLVAAASDVGGALASGNRGRLSTELGRLAEEAGLVRKRALRRAWSSRTEYLKIEPGDERQVYRLGVLGDRLKPVAPDVEVEAIVGSAFRRFTERSPESFAGWMLLGHLLTRQGHLPEAADCYRSAAERYPLRPELWTLLGDACLRDRPERAIEAYARALEVNREVEDFATTLFAKLWESAPRRPRSGRIGAGLEYVTKATGPSPEVAWRRGLVYVSAGGYGEAAAQFEKALGLRPQEVQLAVFRWLALEMRAELLHVRGGTGDPAQYEATKEAKRAAAAAREEAKELQRSAPPQYRLPPATLDIIRRSLRLLRRVAVTAPRPERL
jgi:tetratricopeptide (TPR) repeat protein